jgi:hypothetical protein
VLTVIASKLTQVTRKHGYGRISSRIRSWAFSQSIKGEFEACEKAIAKSTAVLEELTSVSDASAPQVTFFVPFINVGDFELTRMMRRSRTYGRGGFSRVRESRSGEFQHCLYFRNFTSDVFGLCSGALRLWAAPSGVGRRAQSESSTRTGEG